jgi:hypothetical protein
MAGLIFCVLRPVSGSSARALFLTVGLQHPDPSHWSQQLDWHDDVDNYELTNAT